MCHLTLGERFWRLVKAKYPGMTDWFWQKMAGDLGVQEWPTDARWEAMQEHVDEAVQAEEALRADEKDGW